MIMFAVLLLTLMFVFILGPKESIEFSIKAIDLPDDLDSYLLANESNVRLMSDDIKKTIRWVDPDKKQKTKFSIIYLHGYTATSRETHPLTNEIADRIGANVYYIRLTGHGQPKEEFMRATVFDWSQDTMEAWEIGKRIGEKVIIIGTSTGATLASWLATSQDMSSLAALVFISPNFGLANKTAPVLLLPWGVQLAGLITGSPYYTWEPANKDQGKYWQTSPSHKTTAQLAKLVSYLDQQDLSEIKAPLLTLYSEYDDTVSVPKIKEKQTSFGSERKQLISVDSRNNPSKHVLAGDIVGYNTTGIVKKAILDFLASTNVLAEN